MKNKVMSLGLLALALTSASAHARSLMPAVIGAPLERINLDQQLPYAGKVRSAEIKVDYSKGLVTLTMMKQVTSCPTGARCFVGPIYVPVEIELPIVSRERNECGTLEIVARHDGRQGDGSLRQLNVRDNTANHCPTFAAVPATEVLFRTKHFDRVRGQEVSTRSTLDGGAMHPIYKTQIQQ